MLCTINISLKSFTDAKKTGRRALKINKKYTLARYYTAVAQYHLKEFESAIKGLKQVISEQPDHGMAFFVLGMCREEMGAPVQEIVEAYERCLSLFEKPPQEIVFYMAKHYERTGNFDRAIHCLNQSLIPEGNAQAILLAAEFNASAGNLDLARQELEALVSNQGSIPYTVLAPAYNRLGLILDRQDEYDLAYKAISKSQQLVETNSPKHDIQIWYKRIEQNLGLSRKQVEDWKQSENKSDQPDPIFLVGFPRSGTTLTERIIASHPELTHSDEAVLIESTMTQLNKMTSPKQSYLEKLDSLTDKQIKKLQKHYWSEASKRRGVDIKNKRFLDKLPLNLIDLSLIHRLFPDAPILMLVRDPRDVCLSCFMQLFDPSAAMDNFYSLDRTAKFYNETMKLWWHYKDVLDLNLHVLRYEDLVSDTENQIRQLISFLDLPWDEQVLRYYQNKRHKVSTPSVYDTAKPIFTRAVERWRNYSDYVDEISDQLTEHIEKFGYPFD